jgi:transposase
LVPNRFPSNYRASAENQVLIGLFLCDIIPKIVEGMLFDFAKSPRKLMLHLDNATPHRARATRECLKQFRIRPIRHPLYSSDLAPSDFYLFGELKGAFAG